MCVQDEGRLKLELGESALMAMEGNDRNPKRKGRLKYHHKVESRRQIGVFFFWQKERAHEEGLYQIPKMA